MRRHFPFSLIRIPFRCHRCPPISVYFNIQHIEMQRIIRLAMFYGGRLCCFECSEIYFFKTKYILLIKTMDRFMIPLLMYSSKNILRLRFTMEESSKTTRNFAHIFAAQAL
ncbi:uncharacterized protein LOC141591177 [Silene latifolia]|uniref:uncharacterized protein LOC141591177 n=1 Tax=Silene latifolia TaxID=37657 RepID=UPI003D77F2D6